MKHLLYTILSFIAFNCSGQDSAKTNNAQIFIDSLKEKSVLKIQCYASNCFHHENYAIFIWKNGNKYFSKLTSKSSIKGSKEIIVKKSNNLNSQQIDSVRKFEHYLTIYPSEDTDGQTSYFYTLSVGKKKKLILDGMQSDPWMKIEGLIKILYPKEKQK